MPLLTCPNDNAPMQPIRRDGVEIDVCPQCRGVWLDRGELEKLLTVVRAADQEDAPPAYPPAQASAPLPPRREAREWRKDDDDDRYRDDYYRRKKKGRFDIFDIFD